MWIKIASFFMLTGVVLGAFGSHVFKDRLTQYSVEVFKTGVLYQFIHALGLFIVAWLMHSYNDPKISWAGVCFLLGIIFFSGSLYLLALTQIKFFGPLTPLGGLFFMAGWILLMVSHYS